jgi:hypothetical protein
VIIGLEDCDNSNLGCSSNCSKQEGYSCYPFNNTCSPICGDGLVVLPEECDNSQIGCVNCRAKLGYQCVNNNCSAICGDGIFSIIIIVDFVTYSITVFSHL